MLDTFHHKAMRRIMGVLMSRAKDEIIRNSIIRKWFCDAEKMVDAWSRHQLLFFR